MPKDLDAKKEESLLERTRRLLRRSGLRARKGLGQHFLVDEEALQKIIDAAALSKDDTVIEVGPGLGILTAELARRAGWVIAIELDDRLAAILRKTLPYDNVVIINQDVLGTDPAALLEGQGPAISRRGCATRSSPTCLIISPRPCCAISSKPR